MNRRRQWGVVGLKVVLFLLLVGLAFGVTYEPGPAPVVGEIQHYTYLPPNTSRTEIGVRESIQLYIDQWQDQDVSIDDEGNRTLVQDDIGDVVWLSCPGRGKFNPPVGRSTKYTAGLSDFNDGEQVSAQVWDSRKMGLDWVVYRQISLQIRVPSGNVPYWFGPDQKLGTDGPPDHSLGVATTFAFQVQPNTVNFQNIAMKETRDYQDWDWPNTKTSKYVADVFEKGISVGTFPVPGQGMLHNSAGDWICTGGPWKVERITVGGDMKDATFPVKQKLWFQNTEVPLGFKMYQETTHPRWFYRADMSSKVGWQGNGNAETKEERGPYQQEGL